MRMLWRRIGEGFFFNTVIIGAGLAAKAAHIVERLVAVPARALRLEVGHAPWPHAVSFTGIVGTIIRLVCLHDGAER